MSYKYCYIFITILIFFSCEHKRFKEGQTWTFKTKREEYKSTLTILKIIPDKEYEEIIIIRLDSINYYEKGESLARTSICFFPCSKKAISVSVIDIVNVNNNFTNSDDFHQMYDIWIREYENGKADAYDHFVDGIIDFFEDK